MGWLGSDANSVLDTLIPSLEQALVHTKSDISFINLDIESRNFPHSNSLSELTLIAMESTAKAMI